MTDMRYQALGASGLMVSVVGLGGNNFGRACDVESSRAIIDTAMQLGVTLIDTADVYGESPGDSESVLGEVLAGRREEFVLATKFGMDVRGLNGADHGARGSRRYIRRAIEGSLRRLGTDYVDLYQLHAPDPITPIAETIDALDELVREGKVRYLGHSNLSGWQIADADWTAANSGATPFISAQNHYSLLEREVEAEVVPACERFGLGLLPYFPLANGMLTGKHRRGEPPAADTRLAGRTFWMTDERFDKIEALEAYASSIDATVLQLALGGLAAQPTVASVIAGVTKTEQLQANVAAGLWQPTATDLEAIDAAAPGPRTS